METAKIKVGVVGGGAIAQGSHIPGYAANDRFELTAIADPCANSLNMVREKWSFKKEYSDYKEMLAKEKLDVVSVCTPNKFHAEIAIAALNSGADVVLEKPIALSLADGKAIKAAAEKNNKRVFVCFSHRFNDHIRAAKSAIENSLIGKPYMIRIRFAHSGPWPGWAKTDWFYNPEMAGGGALLDMAVHAIDMVHNLVGEITSVSAKAVTLRKNIAVDDNVVAWLEIGKDCLGYIEAGWTSPAGLNGVEIMGDNGCIIVDYGVDKGIARFGVSKPDGTNDIQEKVLSEKAAPHWVNQMAEITGKIADGSAPDPDINDGIAALEVTLAAYESSRTDKVVKITGK